MTSFGDRQGYAEKLLPLSQRRWQQLVAAMQRENYPSLACPAITVCLAVTSLRPGEERWDVENGGFYHRILGMTVLPGIESR